jgi:hypothetical protein
MSPVATLARFTFIEARRGGLPWLAIGCIAAAIGLAGFISQVAITESLQLQAALVAALLRACAVFLVATHVVTSAARESADKGVELALSLPLSRSSFYLGKLAGHAAIGASIATAFALPLLIWASAGAVLAWWISLGFECLLAAALGMFFVFTLASAVPALCAVAAFYLLGRTISALQLIAAAPVAGEGPLAQLARWGMDGVALLMPRLDEATRTDWIVYGAPQAADLAGVLLWLSVYAALACTAGMIDFHRRNL